MYLYGKQTPRFASTCEHLIWENRAPSPFISLFNYKIHAANWAQELKENISLADHEVEIVKIEGMRLDGMRGIVFLIEHLVNYGILEKGDKDEFVGSFHIPREAIAGPVLF